MLAVLRIALVLAACLPAAAPSRAQPVLDQAWLDIPFHRQDTLNWCWVASAKMVIEALGIDAPSQCAMLTEQFGAPCCEAPALCDRPGYIGEIQALIASFGGHASTLAPPTDGFTLLDAIRNGRLIVLYIDNSHFVVLEGMRVVDSPVGPWGIVSILDPLRGRYELDYPALLQRWGAAVVVY